MQLLCCSDARNHSQVQTRIITTNAHETSMDQISTGSQSPGILNIPSVIVTDTGLSTGEHRNSLPEILMGQSEDLSPIIQHSFTFANTRWQDANLNDVRWQAGPTRWQGPDRLSPIAMSTLGLPGYQSNCAENQLISLPRYNSISSLPSYHSNSNSPTALHGNNINLFSYQGNLDSCHGNQANNTTAEDPPSYMQALTMSPNEVQQEPVTPPPPYTS